MPERLQLTKNAQFYFSRNTVSDSIVNDILSAATDNMGTATRFEVDKFRIEENVIELGFSYKYSVRVFPSARPVYFIDEDLEDRVFAFILLIEYQGYIAIFKKSCANITELLKEHFTLIGSRDLTGTFNDNEVEFQKISLRNMTVSGRDMRVRSYEAANLMGLLSTHSAGRSIPFYLKLRHGSVTKTISSTGRLVESSQRKSLDEIAAWVKEQVELFKNPPSGNNFLNSFAKKAELTEVLSICRPNAILIESTALSERIVGDSLVLKYKTKRGRTIAISSRILNKLYSDLEIVYEIDSNLKVVGKESCSRLRKNEKSLTITSKILTKFRVIEHGKEVTLQHFIIKHGYYSVTFTDPKYMYFMGACFEDSSGVSEIDSILDILTPCAEIQTVTSEKGQFTNASTNFDVDSMFGMVESLHQKDDYIFCDDLGIEWADHITLNSAESNISFIHSKHGNTSNSASNLHDVVGQGIKNLGNMYFTKEQLIERINDKFSKTYNNDSISTRIVRIRKGDPNAVEGFLDRLIKDYKLNRKCILSCSFLSKSSVAAEFSKIQRGVPVPGHVIQLFWIISSFAHAVKEMNIIPIIYCKD